MKCKKCGKEFEEKDIQEHHIHPRFMDNPNGWGKKMYLCKRCHDILHKIMTSWIYDTIPMDKRKEVIRYIIKKTEEYGNKQL